MAVLSAAEAGPHLHQEYKDGRLVPFLGAGFSKPLRLPDWSELVGWMAERLDFETDLFHLHGRYEQLAEYFQISDHNNFQHLVYEMTRRFDSEEAVRARRASSTHQALAGLDWRTVYTTNYDSHVEGALRDAKKKVAVLASFEDFQGRREPGTCEVIKFHGTLTHPETIVLTESSYFRRMALEAPVDQRLRADLLSNSFLFLGYSFSDTNIRYIWYRMHQLRLQGQPLGRRPHARRCYFAAFGAGPIQPELLEQWNIDMILLDPEDKNASVTDLLQRIQSPGSP
ncbi:SIR2 family protein [Hyalangium rubrum]|uniref:SIR2 family protein n=1 Tax=Hyalangium rubrum TaxID=3103134 RepID=A0ABU5HC38_9BACT|nr:SIR2 family protein [Hyalangium sp. s54d21]MDY7230850.1 SIR2 family protein [Hyalangium sp. s54d21]